MKTLLLPTILFLLVFGSCKKENEEATAPETTVPLLTVEKQIAPFYSSSLKTGVLLAALPVDLPMIINTHPRTP